MAVKQFALSLLLIVFSCVASADFQVYWTTDGIDPVKVKQAARQFSKAMQKELGIRTRVDVVSIQEASNAFLGNETVDLLITCNEVNTRHGIPLGNLSSQPIDRLSCRGGSRDSNWALGVDQDVNRQETGEVWVYFLRTSEEISQARKVRDIFDAVKERVELNDIVSASL